MSDGSTTGQPSRTATTASSITPRTGAEKREHGLAESVRRLDEDEVAASPAGSTVLACAISAASSAAQAGPVMKSFSPVSTSVGAVIRASSGRRSNDGEDLRC